MPIRRTRVTTRRPGMKKARRFMRRRPALGRARIKRTSDYAKLVETVENKLIARSDGNGEATGDILQFCLQDYQRAQEVAHAYKYYRCSKVEVTFIPYFNISQTGAAGAQQLPQLYMSVDRVSNRFILPTESEFLSRGVSPKLFTRKQKLIFKPNLLQGVSLEVNQDNTGPGLSGITAVGYQNAVPLFNKWLPTQQSYGYPAVRPPGGGGMGPNTLTPTGVNPYALNYHGAIWCVAIEGQPEGDLIVGDFQLKVTWEFKSPRALKTNAPGAEPNPYAATSSQGTAYAVPNTQPTTYP